MLGLEDKRLNALKMPLVRFLVALAFQVATSQDGLTTPIFYEVSECNIIKLSPLKERSSPRNGLLLPWFAKAQLCSFCFLRYLLFYTVHAMPDLVGKYFPLR